MTDESTDPRPPPPAPPRVALAPRPDEGLEGAIAEGGGRTAAPEEADALVWTAPDDAEGLKATLEVSPARWVQLPFAGIEGFVAAGAIDPARTWTCAKGIYGAACAEHALALMLAAARRLHRHVRAATWSYRGGLGAPERRLRGLTVLVFGAGGIGRELIRMLRPLDVRTIAVNRSGAPVEGAAQTVPAARLADVVPEADFVVLAAALTDETRGVFDAAMLRRMRRGAWLVNVARGGLVVTDDLVTVLEEGAIGGGALDVTDPEPLPDGHPLWALDNVLITPHVANTWDMALPELRDLVRRNVARFAAGEPLEGVVDPALGY